MRSVILKKYNTSLVIQEVDSKKLQSNEVRIATAYAGLSFTDQIIQQGLYKYQRLHMPLPYTLGFEASGTIVEIGSQVTEFSVGDNVVVLQRSGCLSSEIVALEDNVIPISKEANMAWAASLPVNFFTACHALENIVRIFPKSNILITSAAGGVGGMLVQMASKEHVVTGLVGQEDKKDYVKGLGACEVGTYTEFLKEERKFDVIFVASGKNIELYTRMLNKNGKLIVYGFHSMVPKNLFQIPLTLFRYLTIPSFNAFNLVYHNKTISGFNIIGLDIDSPEFNAVKNHFFNLEKTDNLPKVQQVHEYALKDVNLALKDLASGNIKGKIVIKF